MFKISKDFSFSASHHLSGLPEGHQCSRDHGHNYVVRVSLQTPDLDRTGFVLDYGALSPVGDWIEKTLDHRNLNQTVQGLEQPTAENLAHLLHQVVHHYVSPLMTGRSWQATVSVSETPKTWAHFEGPVNRNE